MMGSLVAACVFEVLLCHPILELDLVENEMAQLYLLLRRLVG